MSLLLPGLVALVAALVWLNVRATVETYKLRAERDALQARLDVAAQAHPVFAAGLARAPDAFAAGRASVTRAPPQETLDANGDTIRAGARVSHLNTTGVWVVYAVAGTQVVLCREGEDVGVQCSASEVVRLPSE